MTSTTAASQAPSSTYTLGHSTFVLASHQQRTIHNSAAFLLPHLAPHFSLLDVGCGPGTITVGFVDVLFRGTVTGVDLSQDVIDEAIATQKQQQQQNRKNLTFEVGNVLDGLKYPDNSFDVVYTHQTLIHVPHPVKALQELRRVLKPGGILATRECTNLQWWPLYPALELWGLGMQKMMESTGAVGLLNKGILQALVREAGFDRDKTLVGVGTTVFATKEERKWWSGVGVSRMRETGIGNKWQKSGFLTDVQIDQIIKALEKWGEAEDGWYVAVQTLEAEQSPEAATLPETSASMTKSKRRRQKKKGKSHAIDDTKPIVDKATNHAEDGERPQDVGIEDQQEPTPVKSMGSHSVETIQEAKRRKQKERKLLKRQSQRPLEGDTNHDPASTLRLPEVPSANSDPHAAESAADNKQSKKRKRHNHVSTTQPHLANHDFSKIEQSHDVTAMDVDLNGPEVKTISLEHRITVPDDFESRQHMPKMNGDALSADTDEHKLALEGSDAQPLEISAGDKVRPKKHGHRAYRKSSKYQTKQWTISEGVGGIFIDQDPILTADDQHMIISTRAQVRIYSRVTSLLVRKLELEPEEDGPIVSCSLLTTDDSLLIVATSRGVVSIWNWTDGTVLEVCLTGNGLKEIVPFSRDGVTSIVAVHATDDKDTVKVFNLATGSQDAEEVAKIYECRDVERIQFFESVGIIVISARSLFEIGHCRNFVAADLDGDSFKWYRLRLPANVASFDARVSPDVGRRLLARLDLTMGLSNGDILNYTDVLSKLMGREKGRLTEIEPQKLSWHRYSVNTVKWSRDLTHIISGGSETTLVIWQLDTNRQQYLPHLSAPILNISVSEKGSAYALRLADNSVMVLATTNLTPETNVSGLAAPVYGPLIATLDPNSSEKVLLACPAAALQPLRQEDQNIYLQTYDIYTDTQLGRQALTRNLTTVVNVDPEGRPRREPNVSRLQISADGRWLVTIDEWRPLHHDLDATHLFDETQARKHDSETRLRIWAYNTDRGDWKLVTRVDEPNSVARILSVQTDPTKPEFAAVGADGIIRVWQPKARVRDGVLVRDAQGKQLFTWMNRYAVNVPLYCYEEAKSAALTYSEDGSIIAVSLELDRKGSQWAHLLDARTGKIVHSIPDLVTVGERCLAISGRYLLLLSRTFCVYDLIACQVICRTELAPHFHSPKSSRFLAVNRLDNTVAFALSRGGRQSSHLTVIDANKLDKGPVLETKVPGQTRALMAHVATTGFVLIDSFHQVRIVKPPSSARALVSLNSTTAANEPEEVAKGLDRLFGTTTAVSGDNQYLLGGETQIVTGRGLEEAFSFATSEQAPNMEKLFEWVARAVVVKA
ncbi:hypothetical protein DV736_g957, partial [Chaetothyriales sp. CBS 134916]